MATQSDYTAGANAIMHLIYTMLSSVPQFERNFIPMDKIPAASGKAAQVCIDAVDAHRAQLPSASATVRKRGRKLK
jgi:hypothetical protein